MSVARFTAALALGLIVGLAVWAMLWWVGGVDDSAWAVCWLSGVCLGVGGLLGGLACAMAEEMPPELSRMLEEFERRGR